MFIHPSETKKYSGIILGVVVMVGVLVWYFSSSTRLTVFNPSISRPVSSVNSGIKNGTGAMNATGTGELKAGCDRFAGPEKTGCEKRVADGEGLTKFVAEAVQQGDPEFCDTAPAGAIIGCKDIVYYEKAMKSKNKTDCDKIQEKHKQALCIQTIDPTLIPSPPKKK